LAKNEEDIANKVWAILEHVDVPMDKVDPIKQFERKYIILSIIEGRNLAPKDSNGLSDPYLKITYGENSYEQKTQVIHNTLNPIWGEAMTAKKYEAKTDYPNDKVSNVFKIPYKLDKSRYSDIIIECRDKDETKEDDFMGIFRVYTLKSINKVEFYLLEHDKNDYKKKQKKPKNKEKTEKRPEKSQRMTKKEKEKEIPSSNMIKSFRHVSGTITISLMFADENDIESDGLDV